MDGEIEMQQQQPLLDDGAGAASPFIDLHEPRPLHKKGKKRSRMTVARFCVWLCALSGIAVVSLVVWTGVKIARSQIQGMKKPHGAHHGNETLLAAGLAKEGELVRPYFGPNDRFDLGAMVWARWHNTTEDEPAKDAVDPSWLDSKLPKRPVRFTDWQFVHRSIVLDDVLITTKKPVQTSVPVVIPKEFIPYLIDPALAPQMVASFVMLPPSFEESSARLRDTHWSTVRSSHSHYPNALFEPPLWMPFQEGDETWSPFRDFFSYGAARSQMLHHRGRTNTSNPNSMTFDVLTRSHVTLARDFPVYNVTHFRNQLEAQKNYLHEQCLGGSDRHTPPCWRKFSRVGHYENLLELDERSNASDYITPNDNTRCHYAPFITADLLFPSYKDYAPLPVFNASSTDETAASDFHFDWRIAFSTASPLHLASSTEFTLSHNMITSEVDRFNVTDLDAASSHVTSEFFNALFFGHLYEPNTRPLLREGAGLLSSTMGFLYYPVHLFYWLTRSFTTGISMPSRTIDMLFDVIWSVLYGVRVMSKAEGTDFWSTAVVALDIAWRVLLALLTCSLALRLDWMWGGPWGWMPVSVTRRRPTHSERASARADAAFTWRNRIVFFVAVWLALAFLPNPHIVPAPNLGHHIDENDVHFRVTTDTSFLGRQLIPLLVPFMQSLWFSLFSSQLLLNHRRRTFAGFSRVEIFLQFAQTLCQTLPVVLHRFVGKSAVMSPWKVVDLIALALEGAVVYQAIVYPAVPQTEEEDE